MDCQAFIGGNFERVYRHFRSGCLEDAVLCSLPETQDGGGGGAGVGAEASNGDGGCLD